MPSFIIDRFLGLDKKSSDTDLDSRILKNLKNFSTTKKPGSLFKTGTYSDVSTSLTGAALVSGLTLKSLFQFGLTLPSVTDLYLIHATDGDGKERIYVGQDNNDTNLSQMPATGWRELTEHEGKYTIEAGDITAGTDANQIVIDSGNANYSDLSSTNDYYNNWYLVAKITARGDELACRVLDYTVGASTKTFDVTNGGLTGIVATDTFTLARNLPFSAGNSLPSYGSPPRFANFGIDDTVRWLARNNTIIGMCGNGAAFDSFSNLRFVLWYGYINRTFGLGGNAVAFNDFTFDLEQLLAPASRIITTSTVAGGNLQASQQYKIHIAYLYDGYQIGPKIATSTITLGTGDNTINYELRIPFDASYEAEAAWSGIEEINAHENSVLYGQDALISRRCTGIRIYLEKVTGTSTYDATFVEEKIFASNDTSVIDFTMDADGILSYSGTITEEASGNLYTTDVGQTNIRPNFAYGTAISTHFIAAKIINEGDKFEAKNNYLIASVVDGTGVVTEDVFGASNVINLGFYGSKEITGVYVIGDEGKDQSPKASILIFTDDDYYVLGITGGSSFSYKMDNRGLKEGLFAPNSLFYAEGNLFGVSRNGFRIFTPQGTKIIGEGLKTDFDALTDPGEGIGSYFKTERIGIFHFKTDKKTYAVDLLSENLNMFELDWNDAMDWFTSKRDGGLLSINANQIFQHGSGNDQAGTVLNCNIKTKRFHAGDMIADELGGGGKQGDEIIFTEAILKYKSVGSGFIPKFYLDNSETAVALNNVAIPIKTTEGEYRFLFPLGTRGKEAELELDLTGSDASSNTDLEINRLIVKGYIKRRMN